MASDSSIQGLLGSNATTQTSSSSSSTASSMDMDAFLQMFLAQLKYQDPTNPLESYELAAQLAQFSTVEKLTQANTMLQNLTNYSAAINNAEMASLVGKNITATRNTIDVKTDSIGTLGYQLDEAMTNVTVRIKDSDDNLVYTSNKGSSTAGNYTIEWDGKDTSGNTVSEGEYTVEVTGVDSSGTSVQIQTTITGTAASLILADSNPYYLLSDGTKVPAANISRVATGS